MKLLKESGADVTASALDEKSNNATADERGTPPPKQDSDVKAASNVPFLQDKKS